MIDSFKFQNWVLGLFVLFAMNSCDITSESEKKQQEEEQKITNYINKNNITVKPTESGLYYISQTEGSGDTPGDNDFVVIRYKAWSLEGSLLDSSDSTDVQNNYFLPLFKLSGSIKFSMKNSIQGWIETLKKMKVGGKAIAIMPSLLTFKDNISRRYEFQLIEVIHDISSYERQKIDTFVVHNGKTLADSTSSGIYYIETSAGTGVSPSFGKSVSLKIEARLIDGRIFDTSLNYAFTVGSKQVVPGLEEAVQLMKVGGKGTVVLPYYMAYGTNAEINIDKQIVIPWYSTIVYDLQLLSVQ